MRARSRCFSLAGFFPRARRPGGDSPLILSSRRFLPRFTSLRFFFPAKLSSSRSLASLQTRVRRDVSGLARFLTRDGRRARMRVSEHSLSLFLSSRLFVSLSLVLSSRSVSVSHSLAPSFSLAVPSPNVVGESATKGNAHRADRTKISRHSTRDRRAPPSLTHVRALSRSPSPSHVCSSPATMLDARRHDVRTHGAREPTHARTHG